MSLTQITLNKATDLLHKAHTPQGFVGSTEDIDNYKRVWGRDGAMCALAALISKDDDLIAGARQTLLTLLEHQDETGRTPSNVTLDGTKVSYGTTVGRIDATLWFCIIASVFLLRYPQDSAQEQLKTGLSKALFYLKCLELNGRGFLYIPTGGDWADEYVNEGYVLYDELLYYLTLRGAGKVLGEDELVVKADHLKEKILVNFFPVKETEESEHVYHKTLYEKMISHYISPVPLAAFSPRAVNDRVDLFAVALLDLTGWYLPEQKKEMDDAIRLRCNIEEAAIYPAFCPIIDPDDPLWSTLRSNFLFRFKNKPYEFHNGGLWPAVYGLYLAGLGQGNVAALEDFSDRLQADEYRFTEFFNGMNKEPAGTAYLTMGAAGYLIAYKSVIDGVNPFATIIH